MIRRSNFSTFTEVQAKGRSIGYRQNQPQSTLPSSLPLSNIEGFFGQFPPRNGGVGIPFVNLAEAAKTRRRVVAR